MPADARPIFESQWVLAVTDARKSADEPQVDEEVPVDLRA